MDDYNTFPYLYGKVKKLGEKQVYLQNIGTYLSQVKEKYNFSSRELILIEFKIVLID